MFLVNYVSMVAYFGLNTTGEVGLPEDGTFLEVSSRFFTFPM